MAEEKQGKKITEVDRDAYEKPALAKHGDLKNLTATATGVEPPGLTLDDPL